MEYVAIIGPKGSGKSTLISAFEGNSLKIDLPSQDVSIWRRKEIIFIEFNIDLALEYIELLLKCSIQIYVFDPFHSNIDDIDQFKKIVSTIRNAAILILLNKSDSVVQNPNHDFLQKILKTYRLLKEKKNNIELMEVSSLNHLMIEPLKKWISMRKQSYSLKIEELGVILFKLGIDGPQEIYSNLPSTVFTKDMNREEFIQNFIINACVQLTQGEVYPNGVFIIPGGYSLSTKAVTFTWRMQDIDRGRDHRLEQGMFFLSIFLPLTSPFLSIPLSLLEKRFNEISPIEYDIVENPPVYLRFLLTTIFLGFRNRKSQSLN